VCDSHLRSAHWRDDVRGNRPDRVGCLEALARLGVADPLGGRSEMMVTALASEFADISRSGQAGWCRMIVFMSILQTCAEAEAVIARARSRFGDATTSPEESTDIHTAVQTAGAARERTIPLSGSGVDGYQSVVDGSIG
jgi:hypothetical protein